MRAWIATLVRLSPAALLLAAAGAIATDLRIAELRIALAADVTSMDPHAVNITPNNNIGWHVFDALVHVDANARIVPGLAESWRTLGPDTWEFRLRRGVRFHDGTLFTAEDALYSIERARSLPGGQYASFVQRIVSAEASDPYTLRVRTAQPYAMVPYDLNSIFIVSHRIGRASTEDFNTGRAMIGTGPFRFVRFARGDRVELEKNAQYWGGAPPWDKVRFRVIASDPARLASLLAGDVDVIEAIPTADLTRLRQDARFSLSEKVSWRTVFFHLDQYRDRSPFVADKSGKPMQRNPLRDLRVRRALSKAINRDAIVDRVMEGAALPASNLVAPTVFGYVAGVAPERFDPDGAKRLLAEAGYPEGFSLTLHAPNNRYVNDDQIAQAVAQMFTRVGVVTQVQTLPINVYLPKARAGDFSFAMLGWGSFSADLALRALVAAPDPNKGFGAWNWSHYSNPKLDRLLEQGFANVDPGRREALARDAERLAIEDNAVIPLHHQVAFWALRRPLAYAGRTDEYTFAHDVRER